MAYYTYIDGKLQYEWKDSSHVDHTIYRSKDSELALTYRIAFYPDIGAYAACVLVNDGVYAKAKGYWETSND